MNAMKFLSIAFCAMMLSACAGDAQHTDAIDLKIAQLQLEAKEPITRLAFVPGASADEPDIRIQNAPVISPQSIETAAGEEKKQAGI